MITQAAGRSKDYADRLPPNNSLCCLAAFATVMMRQAAMAAR
jgi:hypothetical protein